MNNLQRIARIQRTPYGNYVGSSTIQRIGLADTLFKKELQWALNRLSNFEEFDINHQISNYCTRKFTKKS